MGSSHGKSSTIRDRSVEGTISSDVAETFVAVEKDEILHTRRWKLNPRLSTGVPKGIEGELVVAGWPIWLVAAANNGLNGWLPRSNDSQENFQIVGPHIDHGSNTNPQEHDDDEEFPYLEFYISMVLGFFVTFWGILGCLIVNRSWRNAYFTFLTDMTSWMDMISRVWFARLKQKLRRA